MMHDTSKREHVWVHSRKVEIRVLRSVNSFNSFDKCTKLSQKWTSKNFENSGTFSTLNESPKVGHFVKKSKIWV